MKKIAVDVPGACQAYELVGGVFSKTMNGNTGNGMESGSRHLISTWLPTRNDQDNDTIGRVVRPDLGVATRDFAIDPTQNLIALVDAEDKCVFHILYSLSYVQCIYAASVIYSCSIL